jgi:hypothetical protein
MRYTSLELGHIITRLAYLRMTVEWMCFLNQKLGYSNGHHLTLFP